jgi:peptidyl-prolyl cis-trans isomerase D
MIKFLQNPSKAMKYFIGIMMLLLGGAMVAYLIPGFVSDSGTGGSAGVLAKVGDSQVTYAEVQQLENQSSRQQFPRGVPAAFRQFLMRQAFQQLIVQKALIDEAHRMGFSVSDDELRNELQSGGFGQALFPKGQFIGTNAYEDFVQQQFQMSIADFEEAMKTQMLLRKLSSVIEGGVTVPESAVLQEFERRNTKVKFDYAVLTLDDVLKQIRPTDAELKAFYDKNQALYKNSIPEQRKVQYIVLDTANLAKQVQVTQDDLRRYYQAHIEEFRVPDQVNMSQILIKTPPPAPDGKVDQKAVEAARAKAQDILNKIKAGANFGEIAKKYSEDPTAKAGGEIGWIQHGRTTPEVDHAAFSGSKGEIEMVQSVLGFHIIRINDKQTAHLQPLDEVKSQIEPLAAQDKAQRVLDQLANTVEAEARKQGIQAAAAKHNLNVINTGLISSTDALPQVGSAPELMQAIFSAKPNAPPEGVRAQQGDVIYAVTEVKPPSTPTFEDIKAKVESDFKRQRAGQVMGQKMQELSDRARAQHNLRAAAKEVGATVKTSEMITPESQVPDIGAMTGPAAVAFTMKAGEISGPINTGANGVVIAVLDKQAPPETEFASQKDTIHQALLGQKRNERMEIFASDLRDRLEKQGKLRINQKEVDRYMPVNNPAGE